MKRRKSSPKLPAIPDKLYFSISEVSKLCAIKAYVLRYWEQEFSQLKPVKRQGRRFYQQKDILMVRQIRKLLYEDGYTIQGARVQLVNLANAVDEVSPTAELDTTVKNVIAELEIVLQSLRTQTQAH